MALSPLDAVSKALTRRYEEPHRAYHGLAHVEALLQLQFVHRQLVRDPLAMMLAIWFHDAIYDTRRQDNEAQSAALADEMLAASGLPAPLIDSVQRKVLATQRHEWTDGDPDTALFLDMDLAILASDESAYDAYAAQIAREYDWVPEVAYRQGRRRVLEGFLQRPAIYFTPQLHAAWEARARRNLARELAALG